MNEASTTTTPLGQRFLRLADGSGWVFDKSDAGIVAMKQEFVETGLWSFYVDNVPVGIRLRNHPMDKNDNKNKNQQTKKNGVNLYCLPTITLKPMQQIYCDRKVVTVANDDNTTITFYRLQGSKSAWVFDPRRKSNKNGVVEYDHMMIPKSHIQTGLFAFRYTHQKHPVSIRKDPSIQETNRIPLSVIKYGEVIACDIIRQTPNNSTTQTSFVRLTNGMGWLFDYYTSTGEQLLEPVVVTEGSWQFQVVNDQGIALRNQPNNDTEISRFHRKSDPLAVFQKGSIVDCDRRIADEPTGVSYYRVAGMDGWVFDKRGDHTMMVLLSGTTYHDNDSQGMISATLLSVAAEREFDDYNADADDDDARTPYFEGGLDKAPSSSFSSSSGTHRNEDAFWAPDFVRGIAFAVGGWNEIAWNEPSRMMSFLKTTEADATLPAPIRMNVYYTTRTIGTVMDHPKRGKTQLFRKDCTATNLMELFKNPRMHTGRGYYTKQPQDRHRHYYDRNRVSNTTNVEINAEEELRNSLLEYDESMNDLENQRNQVLESVLHHDQERFDKASKEVRQLLTFQTIKDGMKVSDEERRAKTARMAEQAELRARTCNYCEKVFGSPRAMHQHKNGTGH